MVVIFHAVGSVTKVEAGKFPVWSPRQSGGGTYRCNHWRSATESCVVGRHGGLNCRGEIKRVRLISAELDREAIAQAALLHSELDPSMPDSLMGFVRKDAVHVFIGDRAFASPTVSEVASPGGAELVGLQVWRDGSKWDRAMVEQADEVYVSGSSGVLEGTVAHVELTLEVTAQDWARALQAAQK